MTAEEVLTALELPAAARVARRVPKTLLLEHGAATAADKRAINEGIKQAHWVAAVKPTTAGIAAYRDDEHEYLEIALLHLILRPAAKLGRLTELLHRAVPYPVVAVTAQDERVHLSLVHKRWSQGEAGKTVLEGDLVAVELPDADEPHRDPFLAALALARQPRQTLYVLYQGWLDTLLALQAARRTGIFAIPESAEQRNARRDALPRCATLEAEIARLRAAAGKEKQMARKVELNLELKHAEAELAAALEEL